MMPVCHHLDAGEHWPTAPAGRCFTVPSPNFDVAIYVAQQGDIIVDLDRDCEEVAAILEGSFRIEAEEEAYELRTGEGIIVPPGKSRKWQCTSRRGVIYRILVTQPVKRAT